MEFLNLGVRQVASAQLLFEAAMTCAKFRQPGLNVPQAIGFGLGAHGYTQIIPLSAPTITIPDIL